MAGFIHQQQQDQMFFPQGPMETVATSNQHMGWTPPEWQHNNHQFPSNNHHGNQLFPQQQQTGYQAAPETTNVTSSGEVTPQRKEKVKKKRRRDTSPTTCNRLKKMRRNKANDRERNRMHGLNDALEELR